MTQCLQIYVSQDCPSCEESRRLAEELSGAYPDLRVEVVDLSEPGQIRPPAVFAVPTFLLDGQVVSLGNPDPAALAERLSSPVSG